LLDPLKAFRARETQKKAAALSGWWFCVKAKARLVFFAPSRSHLAFEFLKFQFKKHELHFKK
jgi:hypothetical protein